MQGIRIDADPSNPDADWLPLGGYGKDVRGHWNARTPKATDDGFGFSANLTKHEIVEHEDGTITVSPSILITRHDSSWHGYLEKGIWREC